VKESFKTGDYYTAIASIQSLLTRDTSNLGLLDTLAGLYKQVDDAGSLYVIGGKMIQLDTTSVKGLEYMAFAAARLGRYKDALIAYNNLYILTQNTKYLYELAVNNINSGNLTVGEQIIGTISNTARSRSDLYLMAIGNNQYMEIPVLAMAYYFIGTLREVQGNNTEAKQFFASAINVFPQFSLAEQKLALLNKTK
jgi:tetratricopeptide (TPR) repeat protein